jgi:hypothetical protein
MGRMVAEMFLGSEKEQSGSTGSKQLVIKPGLIIRNSSLPTDKINIWLLIMK